MIITSMGGKQGISHLPDCVCQTSRPCENFQKPRALSCHFVNVLWNVCPTEPRLFRLCHRSYRSFRASQTLRLLIRPSMGPHKSDHSHLGGANSQVGEPSWLSDSRAMGAPSHIRHRHANCGKNRRIGNPMSNCRMGIAAYLST